MRAVAFQQSGPEQRGSLLSGFFPSSNLDCLIASSKSNLDKVRLRLPKDKMAESAPIAQSASENSRGEMFESRVVSMSRMCSDANLT